MNESLKTEWSTETVEHLKTRKLTRLEIKRLVIRLMFRRVCIINYFKIQYLKVDLET